MVRPEKLLTTSGYKARRGKTSGHLVADPSAEARASVPSGMTKALKKGSKRAARNASEPPMTPRQIIRPKGLERPSRACHGEGNRLWSPSVGDTILGKSSHRTLPGHRGRDVSKAVSGTGETLLDDPKRCEGAYKAEPKARPVERESDEVVVPAKRGRTTSWREGPRLESSFWKRYGQGIGESLRPDE